MAGHRQMTTPYNFPPWIPITDPQQLKALGKLAEELGELQSAIARCIIQGMDAKHPVTGKLNADWLVEELTDACVQIQVLHERLNIQVDMPRFNRKIEMQNLWFDQLN